MTSPALFNSLGSLLLAFLMLWAYMSISQVILFYAGNLPEETVWYVRRTAGGWILTALAIAVFGFVVPFSFLIVRGAKRNPRHPGRRVRADAGDAVFEPVLDRRNRPSTTTPSLPAIVTVVLAR